MLRKVSIHWDYNTCPVFNISQFLSRIRSKYADNTNRTERIFTCFTSKPIPFSEFYENKKQINIFQFSSDRKCNFFESLLTNDLYNRNNILVLITDDNKLIRQLFNKEKEEKEKKKILTEIHLIYGPNFETSFVEKLIVESLAKLSDFKKFESIAQFYMKMSFCYCFCRKPDKTEQEQFEKQSIEQDKPVTMAPKKRKPDIFQTSNQSTRTEIVENQSPKDKKTREQPLIKEELDRSSGVTTSGNVTGMLDKHAQIDKTSDYCVVFIENEAVVEPLRTSERLKVKQIMTSQVMRPQLVTVNKTKPVKTPETENKIESVISPAPELIPINFIGNAAVNYHVIRKEPEKGSASPSEHRTVEIPKKEVNWTHIAPPTGQQTVFGSNKTFPLPQKKIYSISSLKEQGNQSVEEITPNKKPDNRVISISDTSPKNYPRSSNPYELSLFSNKPDQKLMNFSFEKKNEEFSENINRGVSGVNHKNDSNSIINDCYFDNNYTESDKYRKLSKNSSETASVYELVETQTNVIEPVVTDVADKEQVNEALEELIPNVEQNNIVSGISDTLLENNNYPCSSNQLQMNPNSHSFSYIPDESSQRFESTVPEESEQNDSDSVPEDRSNDNSWKNKDKKKRKRKGKQNQSELKLNQNEPEKESASPSEHRTVEIPKEVVAPIGQQTVLGSNKTSPFLQKKIYLISSSLSEQGNQSVEEITPNKKPDNRVISNSDTSPKNYPRSSNPYELSLFSNKPDQKFMNFVSFEKKNEESSENINRGVSGVNHKNDSNSIVNDCYFDNNYTESDKYRKLSKNSSETDSVYEPVETQTNVIEPVVTDVADKEQVNETLEELIPNVEQNNIVSEISDTFLEDNNYPCSSNQLQMNPNSHSFSYIPDESLQRVELTVEKTDSTVPEESEQNDFDSVPEDRSNDNSWKNKDKKKRKRKGKQNQSELKLNPNAHSPAKKQHVFNPPGVCGLNNLRNTCYMNSALQCLSNVRTLTEFALKPNRLSNTNDLLDIYCRLIQDIWKPGQSCITPQGFKSAVARLSNRFAGFNQNDCSELLTSALNCFHEELLFRSTGQRQDFNDYDTYEEYIKNNETIIAKTFHVFQKFQLSCSCEQVLMERHEPIYVLNLPQFDLNNTIKTRVFLVRKGQILFKIHLNFSDDLISVKVILDKIVDKFNETRKHGINEQDLIIFDIKQGQIFNIFEPEQMISLDELKGDIFAYEMNSSDNIIVELKSGTGYFGIPLLLKTETNSSLRKSIIEKLKTYFEEELTISDFNFNLMEVIFRDKFCSKLKVFCTGDIPLEGKFRNSNPTDNLPSHRIIGSQYQDQSAFISLDKCLNNYIAVRKMNSEDTLLCSNCQIDVCPKEQTTIEFSPEILILQLKTNPKYQTYYRSYTCDFPLELNFNKYISGKQNQSNLMYGLIAVSNYSGSASFGHYTAYAKNYRNNKWYEFNDSYVSEISENSLVTSRAYLLFYQRL